MELGLCMVVKNEVGHLTDCLESIHDLFDDIIVVDTGSTDGTQDLLESRFGVTPISYHRTTHAGLLDFSAARNLGISAIGAPWVLVLDADERVARQELKQLLELDPDAKDTHDRDAPRRRSPPRVRRRLSHLPVLQPVRGLREGADPFADLIPDGPGE